MCAFGTKTIQEYDDPTTGRSYICTADTTTESCGTDAVTFCVSPYPLSLSLSSPLGPVSSGSLTSEGNSALSV